MVTEQVKLMTTTAIAKVELKWLPSKPTHVQPIPPINVYWVAVLNNQ